MKIEAFPASYGDCFLITANSKHILIDGGLSGTYDNHLKRRLQQIAEEDNQIDLLIITHLHSDHIRGINKYLRQNGSSSTLEIAPIKEIWFNGLRHIHLTDRLEEELNDFTRQMLENLQEQGYGAEEDAIEGSEPISEREGISVTESIIDGGYDWNTTHFFGGAIVSDGYPKVELGDGVSLRILSPNRATLDQLDQEWEQKLRNIQRSIRITTDEILDQSYEYLLHQEQQSIREGSDQISDTTKTLSDWAEEPFQEDDCIVNKSSITFIIECNHHKALFLADGHPSSIKEALEDLNEASFDLVKVAHHGSKNNNSPELIAYINADKYLISTNGHRYNHPDMETLARIALSNNQSPKELIFNYDIAKAWQIQQLASNLNIRTPNNTPGIEINL